MKHRVLQIVVVVWCAAFLCLSTRATAEDKLSADISTIINATEYKQAHWGILVVDLADGKIIHELNADKLFAPASCTKLYSVAAAMDVLGADYKFETPIYRRGDLKDDGQLHGDLILVASGDLSMGGRTTPEGHIAFTNSDHTYANGSSRGELTTADPLTGLNEIARQIAAAGIKHVRGDVLIDDRLFEKETGSGSGPRRITPIMINDNLLDFTITPATVGQPARVVHRPQGAGYQVDSHIETIAESGKPEITIRTVGPRSLVLSGKIPVGHKPLLRVYEVPDAAGFARSLFIEALQRAGVTVDGSPLADHPDAAKLPKKDDYARLTRVAALTSPPFSESAKLILKVSHNLHASTLPLLLAAKHGKTKLSDGLGLQAEFLRRAGVEVGTISFGGGAGGAISDFVTPRATVQLLTHMHGRPDAAAYKAGLPILGMDGTLSDVVTPDSPARGKVFAKTGTLFWDNVMNKSYLLTSKALAGYMTTPDNRELAFALFVNNAPLEKADETSRVGKTLGKLAEVIYVGSGAKSE
jgi:serine-type D-Ala-D-Ala carboxypeptidase/endopeptidase (penicillin-binding protein 4)